MYNIYEPEFRNIVLYEYICIQKDLHGKHVVQSCFSYIAYFFPQVGFMLYSVSACLSFIFPYGRIFVVYYKKSKACILRVLQCFCLIKRYLVCQITFSFLCQG